MKRTYIFLILFFFSASFCSAFRDTKTELENLLNSGISNRYFPGAQLLIGTKEKIIYEKNFGRYRIYFSLAGNTNSDLFLENYNYRGDFDFVVPKIFANNRLHITTTVPYTNDSYITNNAYTQENSIITFNGIPEIGLLTPALNATDVDSTSIFSVAPNTTSPGVYCYMFQPEGNFTYGVWIYNTSQSFTYPDLSGYGFFNLKKGTPYKWTVQKMAPFGNLDDYVSVPPNKIIKNFDTQTNASYFITKADTVTPPGRRPLLK